MLKIEPDNTMTVSEASRLLKGPPTSELLLHAGRNTIWLTNLMGQDAVVKRFASNTLRSVIYTMRISKARRSYMNAVEIQRRGINTPTPIAYIEKRGHTGRLIDSIYVSAYEQSESLELVTKQDPSIMIDFARFVAKLHEAGIRHDDLNSTNVRITGQPGSRNFSLIDLNRMKIYPEGVPVPLDECFDNVTRFSCFSPDFRNFIRAYVKSRHLGTEAEEQAYEAKRRHDKAVDRLKALKRTLMPWKKKYRKL